MLVERPGGGMKITILLQPSQDGGYMALCPEVPGASASGSSWESTLVAMEQEIRETFSSHLEQAIKAVRAQLEEPRTPQPVAFEFAFVAGDGDEIHGSYATVA